MIYVRRACVVCVCVYNVRSPFIYNLYTYFDLIIILKEKDHFRVARRVKPLVK